MKEEFFEKVKKAKAAVDDLAQSLSTTNISVLALIATLDNYPKDILTEERLNQWDTQYLSENNKIIERFAKELEAQKNTVELIFKKKGVEFVKGSMLDRYGL
ncbi:hypothetical protein JWG45_17265 [Leptospira sp. 201903070]|uniref:Flagellar protein FlgN n=1 Tax=Leptospira ainlahdjerensis TaxID=2810033 RepID=A0ABS2UEZ0_9LEPT|nr:hypothetical protein [Leptospira ainlahdjerensis]MBM9578898.1 hypothetical protein [Leptospira ainlahdjerensis]